MSCFSLWKPRNISISKVGCIAAKIHSGDTTINQNLNLPKSGLHAYPKKKSKVQPTAERTLYLCFVVTGISIICSTTHQHIIVIDFAIYFSGRQRSESGLQGHANHAKRSVAKLLQKPALPHLWPKILEINFG